MLSKAPTNRERSGDRYDPVVGKTSENNPTIAYEIPSLTTIHSHTQQLKEQQERGAEIRVVAVLYLWQSTEVTERTTRR